MIIELDFLLTECEKIRFNKKLNSVERINFYEKQKLPVIFFEEYEGYRHRNKKDVLISWMFMSDEEKYKYRLIGIKYIYPLVSLIIINKK